VKIWTALTSWGWVPLVSFCEYDNESLVFIKTGNFVTNWLSADQWRSLPSKNTNASAIPNCKLTAVESELSASRELSQFPCECSRHISCSAGTRVATRPPSAGSHSSCLYSMHEDNSYKAQAWFLFIRLAWSCTLYNGDSDEWRTVMNWELIRIGKQKG
jgi:hypothetical protein